ncbi:MAG: alpha/beta fold hydrolase [Candidatus Hodarchaeales archaeon]|jgi:pimeloyl-ACP methyl ester carboxylesterase
MLIPFVPSDLLEYPVINYFRYRNNGSVTDIKITPKIAKKYLIHYKKDPRLIYGIPKKKIKINWSKSVKNTGIYHSTGIASTTYRPLVSKVLKHTKFDPLSKIKLHKYVKQPSGESGRTVLLFIHGYAESQFIFHEQIYFRLIRERFKSDIIAIELPYHHSRQPSDSPFSGSYFLNGNPVRMLEAFRQSIIEIVSLISSLKSEYDRVLLFGISLGGHLAALSSQFLENIEIIAGLASPFLFRLASKANIAPIANNYILEHKIENLASYYKILYSTNMKYFKPFSTNEKTAVIGGHYDRIVPINQVIALSQMIHKPLFSYPGGHLTLLPWLRSLLKKIDVSYFSDFHL